MADRIAVIRLSCFFQLRQLRSIKQSLMIEATKKLVHAFVGSRLDYCNSVFAGISGQLLHKLQTIQNAAARLITSTKKVRADNNSFASPVLAASPSEDGVQDRSACLCVHGLAPSYLAAFCQATSDQPGRSRLRSADL